MMNQTLAYAAILAHKGAGVSEPRLISILGSVGIVYPPHDVQKFVTALEYIDITDVIKMPILQPEPVQKQQPPNKEEKKEVAIVEEEEGDYGLKALFG